VARTEFIRLPNYRSDARSSRNQSISKQDLYCYTTQATLAHVTFSSSLFTQTLFPSMNDVVTWTHRTEVDTNRWQVARSIYPLVIVMILGTYKVVQIWPGLFVCKQVTVCPGHIWTTLYYISTQTQCYFIARLSFYMTAGSVPTNMARSCHLCYNGNVTMLSLCIEVPVTTNYITIYSVEQKCFNSEFMSPATNGTLAFI
jgi:hypothetical protein